MTLSLQKVKLMLFIWTSQKRLTVFLTMNYSDLWASSNLFGHGSNHILLDATNVNNCLSELQPLLYRGPTR